jgi:hypothetical protein
MADDWDDWDDWDRKLAWVSGQLGHRNPSTEKHYFKLKKSATARRQFADEIR